MKIVFAFMFGGTAIICIILSLALFIGFPLAHVVFAGLLKPLYRRALSPLVKLISVRAANTSALVPDWSLRIEALRARVNAQGELSQQREVARRALCALLAIFAGCSLALALIFSVVVGMDARPLAEAAPLGLYGWSVLTGVTALCVVPFVVQQGSYYLSAAEALGELSAELSAVSQACGGELTLAEREAWRGLLSAHHAQGGALSGVTSPHAPRRFEPNQFPSDTPILMRLDGSPDEESEEGDHGR